MNNDPTEIESTVTIDANLAAKALAALEQKQRNLIRGREWKKNNPDKVREYKRKWNKNNPNKVRAQSRKWKKNNPDKVRAQAKRYYAKKSDRVQTYQQIYRLNNRDKANERCRLCASNRYWKDPAAARAKRREYYKVNRVKINTQRKLKQLAKKQANQTNVVEVGEVNINEQ